MSAIAFTIEGVRLVNETNAREHWAMRSKRANRQRSDAMRMTLAFVGRKMNPPLVVTITRIGRGVLDTDNLAASAKHVRDGVADALGVNDNDPRIEWRYAQTKGKIYGARVDVAKPLESTRAPENDGKGDGR